jgi:hypothetical protein
MKDIVSQGMYQGHWDSALLFYVFQTPGAFLQGGTYKVFWHKVCFTSIPL